MIRVQGEDFDAAAELRGLAADAGGGGCETGAVVTFTGIVRREGERGPLRALTLEHYPGMTETELARIETEARARWPLTACLIVHRHGRLLPGDNIVLVATASTHRRAAFEAAQFLMDFLKTSAPFWKHEELENGTGNWVAARVEDEKAAARWLAHDRDDSPSG